MILEDFPVRTMNIIVGHDACVPLPARRPHRTKIWRVERRQLGVKVSDPVGGNELRIVVHPVPVLGAILVELPDDTVGSLHHTLALALDLGSRIEAGNDQFGDRDLRNNVGECHSPS